MKKIFISSTSHGLQSYRAIATEVIRSQGYDTIVEEHFPFPQASMTYELGGKISDCDGVLAIVGPYYGSASAYAPNGSPASYAQFELLYTLRQQKPCLVLFTTPSFQASAEDEPDPPQSPELAQQQSRFIAEIKKDERFGWATFSDTFEFALALAKHRWKEWLP